MQINITGFLQQKNAHEFMKELWTLLVSAQTAYFFILLFKIGTS